MSRAPYLPLGRNAPASLADVDRRLGLGRDGQALSERTALRYRKLCIRRAVGLDLLTGDPRPRAPKGRSRRKAVRPKSVVDVRSLPHPPTMERALAEIPSHQPSSRRYQGGDAYCSDEPIPLSATLVRFNVHPADVLSCGQFET